ncbi:MAG TPA: MarR family transcriptional regulator [Gammaproteobacteria bacterium]
MKKIIRIGVMSLEDFRKRTIAIAGGKYKPKASEPKIWFASLKPLAAIFSEGNKELLAVIREEKPESLTDLAQLTGRTVPNLSRTLRRMEQHGIVELKKVGHSIRPVVRAKSFEISARV